MTNPKRPIRCSYDASDHTRSGLNGVRHSRMRRGGITDKRATKNWHACEMSFGRLPAYLPLNLVFPRMMGCSAATPTLPYAVVQENCSLPCMRSQKPRGILCASRTAWISAVTDSARPSLMQRRTSPRGARVKFVVTPTKVHLCAHFCFYSPTRTRAVHVFVYNRICR